MTRLDDKEMLGSDEACFLYDGQAKGCWRCNNAPSEDAPSRYNATLHLDNSSLNSLANQPPLPLRVMLWPCDSMRELALVISPSTTLDTQDGTHTHINTAAAPRHGQALGRHVARQGHRAHCDCPTVIPRLCLAFTCTSSEAP